MSSQRPNFFLSGFWSAFSRQTTSSSLTSAASHQPPNKHTTQTTPGGPSTYGSSSTAVARAVSSAAAAASANNSTNHNSNNARASSPGVGPSSPTSPAAQARSTGGVYSQFPSYHHHHHHHHHHSPRTATGIPIPRRPGSGRRRGSDSSSEGFRDVLGAEKLYIGGRTATGEEKFFKLGVVRRVRSGDRLSLDRLSL